MHPLQDSGTAPPPPPKKLLMQLSVPVNGGSDTLNIYDDISEVGELITVVD
jgi:hypothetical protein